MHTSQRSAVIKLFEICTKALSIIWFLFAVSISPVSAQQTKLVSKKISLKDGRKFNLNLPANYEIVPAAENLKRVRFFAAAPDGFS